MCSGQTPFVYLRPNLKGPGSGKAPKVWALDHHDKLAYQVAANTEPASRASCKLGARTGASVYANLSRRGESAQCCRNQTRNWEGAPNMNLAARDKVASTRFTITQGRAVVCSQTSHSLPSVSAAGGHRGLCIHQIDEM